MHKLTNLMCMAHLCMFMDVTCKSNGKYVTRIYTSNLSNFDNSCNTFLLHLFIVHRWERQSYVFPYGVTKPKWTGMGGGVKECKS